MTRTEFRQFLGSYKSINEIMKNIVDKDNDHWKYMNFHISNGRILASICSGEDAEKKPDTIRQIDITKQVVEALIPDELIF